MAPRTSIVKAGAYAGRAVEMARARAVQTPFRPRPGRVVFDSFGGQYSDSPRAIHEELLRRPYALDSVWGMTPGSPQTPPGARTVAHGSPRHWRELGQAQVIVANEHRNIRDYRKKRGTTYLQTWHGTPLKRIGFDHDRWNRRGRRRVAEAVSMWDYLVSPNPFSTAIFRSAFGYDGEVLETGYPRNDVLSAPDREEQGAAVRRALGVEDGRRAVLYAPTWRDDLIDEHGRQGFTLALDLEELSARLGDDHVLLLRLHPRIDAAALPDLGAFTLDVSRHPDIRELYLAADVLLTDYSSAMFDFAVTRKPILFYTYDLVPYRDQMRGFYFELEDEAPGPLAATTGEVVDALASLDAVRAQYAARYDAWHERYCALEDGHAAARVVDAVFGRDGAATAPPAFRSAVAL